jgi:hypothetical protein
MSDAAQSYASHRRLHPVLHMVVMPILIANLVIVTIAVVRHPSLATAWGVVFALGLALLAVCARGMVLTVQDRIIRLEMRLRLAQVLPADLAPRIAQLTPSQLVALRFASDAELPDLVRKSLAGELASGEAIKGAVKDWQADHLRA